MAISACVARESSEPSSPQPRANLHVWPRTSQNQLMQEYLIRINVTLNLKYSPHPLLPQNLPEEFSPVDTKTSSILPNGRFSCISYHQACMSVARIPSNKLQVVNYRSLLHHHPMPTYCIYSQNGISSSYGENGQLALSNAYISYTH
jgi:hypothetical protein